MVGTKAITYMDNTPPIPMWANNDIQQQVSNSKGHIVHAYEYDPLAASQESSIRQLLWSL